MGQRITIEINKKIATCLAELPIVCGNSDYECGFIFDEEWNSHLVKTARFRVNGEYTDVVFEGNVCNMPIISDAKIVWIGVFAGELSTSTPAIVYCKPSILDGEDVPAPPREDVYSQIVGLCEEAVKTANSVEERANNGEFDGRDGDKGDKGEKGEKGDPTEVVQSTGKSKTAVMSQDATTKELDKKLSRSTIVGNVMRAYIVQQGVDGTVEVTQSVKANTLAQRDKNGCLRVGTPIDDDNAATKKYVDDITGDIDVALDDIIAIQEELIIPNGDEVSY